MKETLAKFLGKLLARLYNADFSNQGKRDAT